ncbi:MAG: PRC-barrel domain-containing protein [Xanthobacteraceae bacterium]
MRTRYLVGGLLAVAFLNSTAFAQTSQQSTNPPPAAKVDATAPKLASPHWRTSKMIGLNVYNEQNEKLGDINEIILDKDGKVLGYVVGVGGFLGMGEHDILVEPGKIKFVNEARRTQTSANNPPAKNPNANPPAGTRTDTTASAPRATTEQWYPDHALLSATKDQLKAMPQFKYSSYN